MTKPPRGRSTGHFPASASPVDAFYFRALADSMEQLAWQLDQNGRTEFVNRAWTRYTGLALETSSRDDRIALQHPDDIAEAIRQRDRSLVTGEPYELERRIRAVDGSYSWFRTRDIPVISAEGKVVGWVGTATDIDAGRRASARIALLADSGSVLGESLDYDTTLEQLAELVTREFADSCSIDILGEDGLVRRITTRHRDPNLAPLAQQFRSESPQDPDDPRSVAHVLRTGKARLFDNIGDGLRRALSDSPERLDRLRRVGSHSGMVIPMMVRGAGVGVLTLGREGESPRFNADDLALAEEVARRGALAIDHARLYRSSSAALAHQEFLSRLGRELANSLEVAQTLDIVSGFMTESLADYCIIEAYDDDGRPLRLGGRHRDPAMADVFRRLMAYPAQLDDRDPRATVFRTGKPFVFERTDRERLHAYARDAEHVALMDDLRPSTGLIVALPARGHVIGVVTLVRTAGGLPFTAAETLVVQEAAERAALALDNVRLYHEARARAAELERANAAKDDFLGLVSHELRTPLTTIRGNADILRRHGDRLAPTDRTSVIDDIGQASDRLDRLVDNMLTLSRLERSHDVSTEPVLVHRLLERVLPSLAKRFGRDINWTAPPVLPPALAQPTYLEQVVENLVSNAAKYSPPETPIAVAAEQSDESLVVRIRDFGPGVPDDELPLLTTPFFRSGEVSHGVPGAGLGLAVCRLLVEVQGGDLAVKKPDGNGLEISFSLPLADDDGL